MAGQPLEQVVGWAELAGVRVGLRPGVFVPRRRSTLLVRAALDHLAGTADDRPAVVVDLCCGSGALGLAVASRWGSALDLHAADLDPVAVACARENLDLLGTAHEGDLLDALPANLRGRVDVMVVNAPYVPTAALPLMPREARDHEPVHTLDGGPDDRLTSDPHRSPGAQCRRTAQPKRPAQRRIDVAYGPASATGAPRRPGR